MVEFTGERELLSQVNERLDEWLYAARAEAFEELFEGSEPILSGEELALLDRLDSRLSREEGQGLWGTDEYAVVPTGLVDEESAPRVVPTSHPQLPERAFPGGEMLDDETRTALNEALWEYCQRVVELTQARLEHFVWSEEGPGDE